MIINNPLNTIWQAGIAVCRSKGYTFTADCMHHAGAGNGSTLYFYNDSDIFKKINSTTKFQNLVNKWITEYKSTGKRSFTGSLEFTTSDSADLYYSIQHANIAGSVESNGNFLLTITDIYDFDAIRKGISVGDFGNNLGVIMENLGLIDPFNINIKGYAWAGSVTPPPSNDKYLNLKPHMSSWAVYNENGPYTSAYKIGTLAPSQFGGLSYKILAEKGNDVYIIQTDSFGRCAIWAPRDNDSTITTSPTYNNSGGSGGGGGTTGKYLNLKPHMTSWTVYNENGPYTTAYKIGSLAPSQFGGISYNILAEKGNDVYVIQTGSFGRCAIWAPRDNDSTITSSPVY